ncbi:hypothetical protein SDC9_108258 [bioreactor metagenome]|uniref:Uncharacterized protein n=1 Tax=bioreactor metagenome TaxID=1076179 RepID=A0A645B7G7_9ZZZZ
MSFTLYFSSDIGSILSFIPNAPSVVNSSTITDAAIMMIVYPCNGVAAIDKIKGAIIPIDKPPTAYATPFNELRLFLSFKSSVMTGNILFKGMSIMSKVIPISR